MIYPKNSNESSLHFFIPILNDQLVYEFSYSDLKIDICSHIVNWKKNFTKITKQQYIKHNFQYNCSGRGY